MIDRVATPDELRLAVPSSVEPFRKLTLPVGKVVPLHLTVAVRASVWPNETKLGEAAKLVMVARPCTVCNTGADLLAAKVVLPKYVAVRLWVPAERDDVDRDAVPDWFRVAVPRTVAPFRKETLPVGPLVPLPFTVAVRVNTCLAIIGLKELTRLVVVD